MKERNMTFAEEIEKQVGKDNILAIQLSNKRGDCMEYTYGKSDHPFESRPVPWSKAREYLNYNYYDGFGGQDCHSVYIWTEDKVYYIHEYDGSTRLEYIPRNFG